MVSWLLLLPLLPLSVTAASGRDKLLGVDPALIKKYTPSKSNTWKCLDGSKEIPWSAVNDDYCDCRDGSDEPGTSACPNSRFYCQNKGHIGSFIPSSRVGDGLCEPDCCDGSDEKPGVCPNRCKEIGDAYRKEREALEKIQRTGAKIRSTYIAFAHKEKARLEASIERLDKEIKEKEKEVEKLRDVAERTESLSQAAIEHKKQSPLYKSMQTHNIALRSLQREYKKHLEREKALGNILDALRTGYNPNYQDMAVLEAVRGWEELAGLPHINDVKKGDDADDVEVEVEAKEEEEPVDDGLWTPDQVEYQIDNVIATDYTALLLEHEEHINQPLEDNILFDLANYIPDSLLPYFDDAKDAVVGLLSKLGIVKDDSVSSSATAEAQRAQQALTQAQSALMRLHNEKAEAQKDIDEVFAPEAFGTRGEWKKLDNECLNLNTGDYTYELCLFKEAKQKPNSGGQTFSLGRFSSWNNAPGVEVGSPEYYSKMFYKHGTRCWNGPERSVVVLLSCGVENAVTNVQELEKCEYQFTATTPALCLPLDSKSGNAGNKEEL
ncbi:endoplasmic reticulum protein [Coprinopsis cinerea okayama7|uniref:Glucosidase 2 subunit beta n=1 Tax=Coprinopsis cinerea (strain Okayama-7 / 130 / ATCC MYA-4618 / FGSC 9003) TaxID=240176 RepID=A8P7C7_COPC7|nr:endoplasmic reticulum protein [Coprinopsis cinerea okayama7\|eukprot:XP_001839333.1 endoplasmic reticulum protein [Coprinopsis cinerea okayama7\